MTKHLLQIDNRLYAFIFIPSELNPGAKVLIPIEIDAIFFNSV